MFSDQIKSRFKPPVEVLFQCLATVIAKYPLLFSKLFRVGYFDAQPKEAMLLTPKGTEQFVVSCKDRVIGRRLYASGQFEFENFETMLPLLGANFKRKCLIDIGANIGVICIPAVKRGFFEQAIAIEPEPRNYSLLVANIHINGLENRIEPRNCALGDGRFDEVKMGLCEDNSGDHRILFSGDQQRNNLTSRQTITVPCLTFDGCIGSIDPNSTLIWMDTQGFEGFILAGATEALRMKPPIVVEFWPHGWEQTRCFDDFKDSIVNAGYQWFYDLSTPNKRQAINSDSFDRLYENLGTSSQAFTDLLILE